MGYKSIYLPPIQLFSFFSMGLVVGVGAGDCIQYLICMYLIHMYTTYPAQQYKYTCKDNRHPLQPLELLHLS